MPEALSPLCQYAYKVCTNERALQRDTRKMHSLCEYHRNKTLVAKQAFRAKAQQHKIDQSSQGYVASHPKVLSVDPIPFCHTLYDALASIEPSDLELNVLAFD
ncbi:Aste57867_4746 [Aphanomyces stellatus]|nr:hypothetical protein As57867_004733 [Aphanomyces stellatus]VFT81842.1 Aste57867_4746 [Aphanomyces stellatus]